MQIIDKYVVSVAHADEGVAPRDMSADKRSRFDLSISYPLSIHVSTTFM